MLLGRWDWGSNSSDLEIAEISLVTWHGERERVEACHYLSSKKIPASTNSPLTSLWLVLSAS
jgi:hypothetical protein